MPAARRSPRTESAAPPTASAGALALVCALLLGGLAAVFGRGLTLAANFTHDTLVFFDGIYRVSLGQVPHVDFSTPAGALSYWLPYVGYRIAGQYAGSIEMASLVLAAVVLPVSALLLWRRCNLVPAGLILATIAGLLVIPLLPGTQAAEISNAMQYNRWGWGLLIACLLIALPPGRTGVPRSLLSAVLVAGLLLALLLVKVTFFLVALASCALLVIFDDARRMQGIVAVALCLLGLVAMALVAPEFATGYVADIRLAIEASGASRGTYGQTTVFNTQSIALFLLALYAQKQTKDFDAPTLVFAFWILVSGIVVIDQNFQEAFIASLPVAFAMMIHAGYRIGEGSRLANRVTVGATMLMLLPYAADQARVALRFAMPSTTAPAIHLADISLDGMYVLREPGDIFQPGYAVPDDIRDLPMFFRGRSAFQTMLQSEYVHTLRDGHALLRANAVEDEVVVALDFYNPFPMLLDLPVPPGGFSWLHLGRNVHLGALPPAEEMFGQATFVMLPLMSIEPAAARALRDHYAGYLDNSFAPAGQTDFWILLRRLPG
ncbi:MAG: hypothetical protein NXH82_03120 [Rhodobacteraceae bacterium]|nr:hypothetical protein [Paracoccaceae bacterium]